MDRNRVQSSPAPSDSSPVPIRGRNQKHEGRSRRVRALLAVLVATSGLVGCDSSDPPKSAENDHKSTTKPSRAGAEESGSSRRDPRAKPGYAVGRVLGQDGKPISVPEARIAISFVGVARDPDRDVPAKCYPDVGPDGNYEKKMEEGIYISAAGVVEFPFNGKQFRLALDPVRPFEGRVESSAGVVQDFVWKLSGPRPGFRQPDPSQRGQWFGGALIAEYVAYRDDLKKSIPTPPQGTQVVFSLTPTTPLADGRKGEVVTFKRTYIGSSGVSNPVLADVPLAMYTIRGEEILPDGRKANILFLDVDGKWKDSTGGTFDSNLERASLDPVKFKFTRATE